MRGPLVCATLEDRKWQTRRVVVPQFTKLWGQGVRHGEDTYSVHADIPAPDGWRWIRCPHGKIGDRLWVRETFARLWFNANDGWQTIYRADALDCMRDAAAGQWKPSIHMPRWASRLTLEITGVRVERLQDIRHEDMRAEGVRPDNEVSLLWRESLTENFIALWDSTTTNPAHRWAANPWVWVISYARLREAT